MSGAMESRAAVFTSSPQAVEIFAAGEWLPGSLLGWRHDATGGCQVWVKLALGGAEDSQWTDLEFLRLPERHLAVVATPVEATPVEDLAAARNLRLAGVAATGPSRRGRPAVGPSARTDFESAVTRALPVVRDEVDSRASHPAGRRRADSRVVGETAEFSAVGAAGRHRAPGSSSGSGRHRAADTGAWPVLVDAAAARTREARASEVRDARAEDTWPGHAGESDLLTRPMRLDGPGLSGSGRSGPAPQPHRARRDDTLSGV